MAQPIDAETKNRVFAILRGCETFEHWQAVSPLYEKGRHGAAIWGPPSPYFVMRASIHFSLISLRALDEFFSAKRKNSDDLLCEDLGLDRREFLEGADSVLTADQRLRINKGIVHLTRAISVPDHELGSFLELLEQTKVLRQKLWECLERPSN